MRIYPETTVDYEFKQLGDLGYTGTLNDRQFAALRAEGLTGSLTDMFKQFDGTLGGGSPPDYEALVEAALSGKLGVYYDPTDASVLWQDTGATVAVTTPADPVRLMQSKFGTTAFNLSPNSDAERPAWDTTSLTYDGTDDRLFILSTSFGQNAPALCITAYVKPTSLAFKRTVVQISADATSSYRLTAWVNTDGSVEVRSKRLDADVGVTVTTAAGLVTVGNAAIITAVMDAAGTGGISVRVNGAEVATGSLGGVAGNTSNTVTSRVKIGARGAGTERMAGEIGRVILTAFLPTPTEIGYFEALVSEVAI